MEWLTSFFLCYIFMLDSFSHQLIALEILSFFLAQVVKSVLTLRHQDRGFIFPFKSADTVSTFTSQVEQTTGCNCIIEDQGLFMTF